MLVGNSIKSINSIMAWLRPLLPLNTKTFYCCCNVDLCPTAAFRLAYILYHFVPCFFFFLHFYTFYFLCRNSFKLFFICFFFHVPATATRRFFRLLSTYRSWQLFYGAANVLNVPATLVSLANLLLSSKL